MCALSIHCRLVAIDGQARYAQSIVAFLPQMAELLCMRDRLWLC